MTEGEGREWDRGRESESEGERERKRERKKESVRIRMREERHRERGERERGREKEKGGKWEGLTEGETHCKEITRQWDNTWISDTGGAWNIDTEAQRQLTVHLTIWTYYIKVISTVWIYMIHTNDVLIFDPNTKSSSIHRMTQ